MRLEANDSTLTSLARLAKAVIALVSDG